MALGAGRSTVLWLILTHVLSLLASGLMIGLVAAVIFTRLLQSVLFQVKPADPLVFAAIVVLLVAVVFLAGFIPARRATRVEPNVALRYQ
jgi:ABC-type antimicrobial peptide transport system permease subunit